MCPEVKTIAVLPEALRVRESRMVMPPPTMSYPDPAGRSQIPSQAAIPRRENDRLAPSTASSALSRSAS